MARKQNAKRFMQVIWQAVGTKVHFRRSDLSQYTNANTHSRTTRYDTLDFDPLYQGSICPPHPSPSCVITFLARTISFTHAKREKERKILRVIQFNLQFKSKFYVLSFCRLNILQCTQRIPKRTLDIL